MANPETDTNLTEDQILARAEEIKAARGANDKGRHFVGKKFLSLMLDASITPVNRDYWRELTPSEIAALRDTGIPELGGLK